MRPSNTLNALFLPNTLLASFNLLNLALKFFRLNLSFSSLVSFWTVEKWKGDPTIRAVLQVVAGILISLHQSQSRRNCRFLNYCYEVGSPDHGSSNQKNFKVKFNKLKTPSSRFKRALAFDRGFIDFLNFWLHFLSYFAQTIKYQKYVFLL